MRYKSNGFVGLHLKEEDALIDYIVKAYTLHEYLAESELYTIDKSFRVIVDNQEFTIDTFKKLIGVLYLKLNFEPINFQNDKSGRYLTSGWYDFNPEGDIKKATKRLRTRRLRRRRRVDSAWYREFDESFDWETLSKYQSIEEKNERSKERAKRALGPELVDGLREDRDPGSAVIVPFNRTSKD